MTKTNSNRFLLPLMKSDNKVTQSAYPFLIVVNALATSGNHIAIARINRLRIIASQNIIGPIFERAFCNAIEHSLKHALVVAKLALKFVANGIGLEYPYPHWDPSMSSSLK